MKRKFRQLSWLITILVKVLQGKGFLSFEPLSHYPGTPRFVAPWIRGEWAPSHPDQWGWFEEEEEGVPGYGLYCYCHIDWRSGQVDTDVLKPRATRD
ncbi:MAG: hypothetical protein IPL49_05615 [Saprospirales bacterium]|nr:hypothetical protein [Saprospirales bacterium]MBK8490385.1 hypothetical protein [Saprospirales bacterium]